MRDSSQDIAAGLLGADAFDQAGLNERPQEVERALFGDGQCIPGFPRGEALVVAQQLEELLLFRAENQFLLLSDGSSMSQVIGQGLEVVRLDSGCHRLP